MLSFSQDADISISLVQPHTALLAWLKKIFCLFTNKVLKSHFNPPCKGVVFLCTQPQGTWCSSLTKCSTVSWWPLDVFSRPIKLLCCLTLLKWHLLKKDGCLTFILAAGFSPRRDLNQSSLSHISVAPTQLYCHPISLNLWYDNSK